MKSDGFIVIAVLAFFAWGLAVMAYLSRTEPLIAVTIAIAAFGLVVLALSVVCNMVQDSLADRTRRRAKRQPRRDMDLREAAKLLWPELGHG